MAGPHIDWEVLDRGLGEWQGRLEVYPRADSLGSVFQNSTGVPIMDSVSAAQNTLVLKRAARTLDSVPVIRLTQSGAPPNFSSIPRSCGSGRILRTAAAEGIFGDACYHLLAGDARIEINGPDSARWLGEDCMTIGSST